MFNPADYSACVAAFRLDGDATDTSGNGNNGSPIGSPTYGTGKIGKAVILNGSTQYISVANNAALSPSSITVAMWAYVPSTLASAYPGFIGKGNQYGMYIDGGSGVNRLVFTVDTYSGQTIASGEITFDAWTHVVGTYDGANTKIYINGTLASSSPYAPGIPSGSSALLVGGGTLGGSNYTGSIDEVRIYNRALSSTEVTDLFNFTGGSTAKPWIYAQAMRRLRGAA